MLSNEQLESRLLAVEGVDFVEVKGKIAKMRVYELMGMLSKDPVIGATAEQSELAMRFADAYEAYAEGKKDEARRLFQALKEKFPEDIPTQYYLSKL